MDRALIAKVTEARLARARVPSPEPSSSTSAPQPADDDGESAPPEPEPCCSYSVPQADDVPPACFSTAASEADANDGPEAEEHEDATELLPEDNDGAEAEESEDVPGPAYEWPKPLEAKVVWKREFV